MVPREWVQPETGRKPAPLPRKQQIKRLQSMLERLEQQLCGADACEAYGRSKIVNDIINVSDVDKDRRSIRYQKIIEVSPALPRGRRDAGVFSSRTNSWRRRCAPCAWTT